MKISEYVKKYTKHNRIRFIDFLRESGEFIAEIFKLNRHGISEEFSDAVLFLQAWFWSDFKIDGEIWSLAKKSADKFESRREVWQKIYSYVGLKNIDSKFLGNYKKIKKVIEHLSEFGIEREKAEKAHKFINLKSRK